MMPGKRSSGALQQHSRHHPRSASTVRWAPQKLEIVGIDAVPVNSQDGEQPGDLIRVTQFRLPTGSRVEFLLKAPSPGVKVAQLVTNNINTGPMATVTQPGQYLTLR